LLRSLKEFDILIKVPYPVIFTGVQGRLEFNLIPMGPDLFVDSVRPSLGSFARTTCQLMDGDGFLMGLLLIPLHGVSRQHYKALATSGYLQN
jgi:hypothetical protein